MKRLKRIAKMHFFTSITTNYIPKARVLAKTLKKYNSDCIMHIVVSDDLPRNFDISTEPFDFVWFSEDFIKTENNNKWFFIHNVVELCTAVKAAAALHIFEKMSINKLIYLDPDIAVFSNLEELFVMLDDNSVLLTPHMTEPAKSEVFINADETCCLSHGIYNLGFFAVKNDTNGLKFLNWWNDRLMKWCYDDIPKGLFTDQKWIDLAVLFFDFIKIIKDVEYNVATWNLETRKLTGSIQNGLFVNGKVLKFFHFTGFDSGAHREVLSYHAKKGEDVWKLSVWYEQMLDLNGQSKLGDNTYKYAFYDNGEKILQVHRIVFRERKDVYNYFDNPFGDDCCCWMRGSVLDCQNEKIFTIIYKWLKYKILYKLMIGEKRVKYRIKYHVFKKVLSRISKI
ncbi:MAG: hypothetical protein LBG23_04440, partial [Endomicrobium sp.]|nr:hypothetical protein [Endomicrobium sp.]